MGLTPAAIRAFAEGNMENFIAAATPGGIEAQETFGMQKFLEADALPKNAPWEKLEAMGIERGADIDDLFVGCKLPDGWRKVPTLDHRTAILLDGEGNHIGEIYYKAAFYDRKAILRLYRI